MKLTATNKIQQGLDPKHFIPQGLTSPYAEEDYNEIFQDAYRDCFDEYADNLIAYHYVTTGECCLGNEADPEAPYGTFEEPKFVGFFIEVNGAGEWRTPDEMRDLIGAKNYYRAEEGCIQTAIERVTA